MIRTAVSADLPALQEVFRAASLSNADDAALLQAHPEHLAFAGDGITEGRTRVATLGEGADHVIGFATVVAGENGGLDLEDLFVDPAWQRQGIGRALVLDAVATARAAGHQRLTVIGNPHALAFYRALGFVEVGPAVTELGAGLRLRLDLFPTSPLRLPTTIGLGCMNLSHAYGTPPPEADAERLLLAALDEGVTLFDTAELYGFGANETLVGRVLKAHRHKIVLCSKGGMTGQPVGPGGALQRVIDGRPAAIRRDCEDSLRRLGTEVIDLYYLHRWDKRVPIEESVGALSRLVEQGKVRMIGLSEVSSATIRRAHAVHPIAAVQSEYSLWSRDVERGVLDTCAQIGACLVAFSPLGRGFLADRIATPDELAANDLRRNMPRFQPEAWATNRDCLMGLRALAASLGCSPAQLSLAWVLGRGRHVLAIPGTTQTAHLKDNWAARDLVLSPEVQTRLEALLGGITGARYAPATFAEIDSD